MTRTKNFFSFFHTLRFRLIMIIVLIGLIPFTAAGAAFSVYYSHHALESSTQDIVSQARQMNNRIVSSNFMRRPSNTSINAELSTLARTYSGRIMVINRSLQIVADTYDVDDGKIIIWENALVAMSGEQRSFYDSDINFLSVTMPLVKTTDGKEEVIGCLLIMKSMDDMVRTVASIRTISALAGSILLVLLVAVSIAISGSVTLPLKKMTAALERLRTQQTRGLLSVDDYKEAGDLSRQFNAFVHRMQAIDDSRQEFVSNVSHELKTPLTSMKVLADALNSMGQAPVELYQDFMQDITQEIERENNIINDLLEIVRMDKSGAVIHLAPSNINDLVELILKRVRPIAEKQEVELVFESFRPVIAEVDRTKLSLAITNLVENAIKYNRQGGWVHVSLNADHRYFYLRVEDNGIGIPKDSLPRIFDRFYRVDKSHSREIGGSGLGLAITESTISMHHGQIRVSSDEGLGTTFDVRIPLSYIPLEGENVQVEQEKPAQTAAMIPVGDVEDELPEEEFPEDELSEEEFSEDELPEEEFPEDELPEDETPEDEMSEDEFAEDEFPEEEFPEETLPRDEGGNDPLMEATDQEDGTDLPEDPWEEAVDKAGEMLAPDPEWTGEAENMTAMEEEQP